MLKSACWKINTLVKNPQIWGNKIKNISQAVKTKCSYTPIFLWSVSNLIAYMWTCLSSNHSTLSYPNSDGSSGACNQLPPVPLLQEWNPGFLLLVPFFLVFRASQQTFLCSILIWAVGKQGICFRWKYHKLLFCCLLKDRMLQYKHSCNKKALPLIWTVLLQGKKVSFWKR